MTLMPVPWLSNRPFADGWCVRYSREASLDANLTILSGVLVGAISLGHLGRHFVSPEVDEWDKRELCRCLQSVGGQSWCALFSAGQPQQVSWREEGVRSAKEYP
jgi:hypothetical protein